MTMKLAQNVRPIFLHIGCEKIFVENPSVHLGTLNFRVFAPLGTVLGRFHFFFPRLGTVQARSGPLRRPPRSLLNASYAGKTHNDDDDDEYT